MKPNIERLIRALCSADIALAAVRVSLVVGTILNAINQGPAILAGGDVVWLQVGLNYLVPYCVASYSGARVCLRDRGDHR